MILVGCAVLVGVGNISLDSMSLGRSGGVGFDPIL